MWIVSFSPAVPAGCGMDRGQPALAARPLCSSVWAAVCGADLSRPSSLAASQTSLSFVPLARAASISPQAAVTCPAFVAGRTETRERRLGIPSPTDRVLVRERRWFRSEHWQLRTKGEFRPGKRPINSYRLPPFHSFFVVCRSVACKNFTRRSFQSAALVCEPWPTVSGV